MQKGRIQGFRQSFRQFCNSAILQFPEGAWLPIVRSAWPRRLQRCRLPSLVPHGLTVLAAIRPGEEERLRDVLRPIGDDIRGRTLKDPAERPHIDFCRSRTHPLRALRDTRRSRPRAGTEAPALLVELRRRSRRPPGRVDGDHLRHGRDLGPLRSLYGRGPVRGVHPGAHAASPKPSTSRSATKRSSASGSPSRFGVRCSPCSTRRRPGHLRRSSRAFRRANRPGSAPSAACSVRPDGTSAPRSNG